VGELTGSSTSQLLTFSLPGGIITRVGTKRSAYSDGTEWNGIGNLPTLPVQPTVTAPQARRAPVLEAALRALSAPARHSEVQT
jgi:hypothetical protein